MSKRHPEGENIPQEYVVESVSHQIEIEHGLMSNRLLWYVTSQSFLLAAFAAWIWHDKEPSAWEWVPQTGLPLLGIATSLLTFPMILGGAITMWNWARLIRKYVHKGSELGNIIYVERPRWIHPVCLVIPNIFPVTFAALRLCIWLRPGHVPTHRDNSPALIQNQTNSSTPPR